MKKFLATFLTSCILLGNCIPVLAITKKIDFTSINDINTLSSAQTPISFMDNILSADTPLFPEFKQPKQQTDDNNTSNDTNLCLLSYQTKELKNDCKFNNNYQKYKAEQEAQKRTVVELYLFYLKLLIQINSVFYLVFLIYLVSLSKSNLPWEINNLHR